VLFKEIRLIYSDSFYFHGSTALGGPVTPVYGGFTITLRYTTLGRTPPQPDAENSTRQHTTLTRDKYPCPCRDSNPHSRQANGCRPMS